MPTILKKLGIKLITSIHLSFSYLNIHCKKKKRTVFYRTQCHIVNYKLAMLCSRSLELTDFACVQTHQEFAYIKCVQCFCVKLYFNKAKK